MKLVIAIIHDRDQKTTNDALLRAGFKFTKIGSTGGFLREGNATLLIGVESEQLDDLLELLRESSRMRERYVNVMLPEATPVGAFMSNPVKVEVGGVVAFIMDVERFVRF